MTMQRFQATVLRLGNQMFVRHYHWLNYPNDPQIFGIQFPPKISILVRLRDEMHQLGFKYDNRFGMWTIERTPDEVTA